MQVKIASGSTFMQRDGDGVDRVISYQSRLLQTEELNYPLHDKELHSKKYALIKFRVHLWATKRLKFHELRITADRD